MSIVKVFQGTIIHCVGIDEASFQVHHQSLLGIDEQGKIAFFEDAAKLQELQGKYKFGDDKIEHLGKK